MLFIRLKFKVLNLCDLDLKVRLKKPMFLVRQNFILRMQYILYLVKLENIIVGMKMLTKLFQNSSSCAQVL